MYCGQNGLWLDPYASGIKGKQELNFRFPFCARSEESLQLSHYSCEWIPRSEKRMLPKAVLDCHWVSGNDFFGNILFHCLLVSVVQLLLGRGISGFSWNPGIPVIIWYLVLSRATSLQVGPEYQKGNTASFPNDFKTWKGPAWWWALTSSYLHRKGSATWHWPLKINFSGGKLLNYCLKISLGSNRGRQRKAKGSWFPNILFEPGQLLDSETQRNYSTVYWLKKVLRYFENQVRSYYNFNESLEPQLSDQALEGSGVGRTASNVVPFYVVCLLKIQTTGKWTN